MFRDAVPEGDTFHFFLLVLASLAIAAAGYIINDYFDINIDEINKPKKVVVDKVINRRWAIAWHFMLSLAGIVLTILAVASWSRWYIIAANILCIILLWFYSTSFKRQLLVGNIVISLLTAWTILVIFFSKFTLADAFGGVDDANQKLFRFALLYAGFAFIISLIREAIKDMEDLPGDQRFGCHTMPIAWGLNATKVYTAVWLIVLIAALLIVQVYVLQFRWWMPVAYSVPLIIFPLVLVLFKLRRSNSSADFHRLSNITKFVMFSGILSMIFFYFYL
jgi:4-hydroxybenzoate polyprenyltransferase